MGWELQVKGGMGTVGVGNGNNNVKAERPSLSNVRPCRSCLPVLSLNWPQGPGEEGSHPNQHQSTSVFTVLPAQAAWVLVCSVLGSNTIVREQTTHLGTN